MSNEFNIRYELTDADRRAAVRHLIREAAHNPAPLTAGKRALISLGIIVVAVGLSVPSQRWVKVAGFVTGILLITAGMTGRVVMPQGDVIRQGVGSQKLTVSADGLVVQSGQSSTTTPWPQVERVVTGASHLFIHGPKNLLCIVPRHAFSDPDDAYCLQEQIEWHRHAAASASSRPGPGTPTSPFAAPATGDGEQLLHARQIDLRRGRLKAESRVKTFTVLLTSWYVAFCLLGLFALSQKEKDNQHIEAGLILLTWPATAALVGLPITLGVLMLKPWSRLPLMIWSIAGLLFCPVGTIFAINILSRLVSVQSPALLTSDYARIAKETADIARAETSSAWILAGVMVLLLTLLAALLLIARTV